MHEARCPLCGGAEGGTLLDEKGYHLLACGACGLLFIDPYPAGSEDVHRKVQDEAFEEVAPIDVEDFYRGECWYYAIHDEIPAACDKARSVLDVGCGTGRLLELLGERNPAIRRVGVELSASRARSARLHAACDVHQVPVERFNSDQPFEAITLINVLSHFPDFDALFGSLLALLAPGGRLILKVGELSPGVRKTDLAEWGIPEHMHFLGLSTMKHVARRFALRIVSHVRRPLSAELYSRKRWLQPGPSPLKNLAKGLAARTPLALPALARLYDLRHGRRVFSSLFVLTT